MKSRTLSIIIISFVYCILFDATSSSADVGWAKKAQSCEEFSNGLLAYLASLGDVTTLGPERRGELEAVLAEACGPRLATCRFTVCEGSTIQEPTAAPMLTITPETPATAVPSNTTEAVSATPTLTAIETDPLAWLQLEMSCDALIEQIRVRYSPLGKFSEMPDVKKEELRTVLDISCSERFAHCQFKNCGAVRPGTPRAHATATAASTTPTAAKQSPTPTPKTTATAKTTAVPKTTAAVDAMKEANAAFQKVLEQHRRRQQGIIAASIAEEKKRAAEWKQIGNSDELRAIEERRRAGRQSTTVTPEVTPSGLGGPGSGSKLQPNQPPTRAPNSHFVDREKEIPRQPTPTPRPGASDSKSPSGRRLPPPPQAVKP